MAVLEDIIRSEIGAGGPMRFDRFMDLALYHATLGYYTRMGGRPRTGRAGDFFTSVSVGPLFGRLLARQFFQMWNVLDRPAPFWIIEQGAHDGRLAVDMLTWCRAETPDFFAVLRYVIVGTHDADGLRTHRAEAGPEIASRIACCADLAHVTAQQLVGVFFSNELVDAFPVRVIVHRSGEWREKCVVVDDDGFQWIEQPVQDDELKSAVEALSQPFPEGYATEIHLAARHWMAQAAKAVSRGYMLTIDYGFPASLYYAPFRMGGTLTAYHDHRQGTDVLAQPGGQDITAHVDFTALAREGEAAGLNTLGLLDQQRFLTGIAHDELSDRAGPGAHIGENLRAWNTLTHPSHLGSRFHALLQSRDAPGGLDGLRYARSGGLE